MEGKEDYKKTLEALEAEQAELRHLIGEGVSFEIEVKVRKRKAGLLGLFRKREVVTEKREFKIAEPTLSTLDRLSAVWLQMSIDETKLHSEDYLVTAKQLAAKEAKRLAEVVAIAVLGEDYYDVTPSGDHYQRKPNRKRLAQLTATLLHAIKPSELLTLAITITNVSNLGDFINSIRLMQASRTSDPTTLIEPQD